MRAWLLLLLPAIAAAPQDPKPDPLPEMAAARLGSVPFKAKISVRCLAVSPDGRTLAVGPGDSPGGKWMPLTLWDLGSGKERLNLEGDTGNARALAFSPSGKRLASVGHERNITLWDAETGKKLAR